MPVTVLHKPDVFTRLSRLPSRLQAGVAVKGEAVARALVWEWGTVRFRQPGPKTVWGKNPDAGDVRIFTRTAPSGYVRIHKQQFFDMVTNAVTAIPVATELKAGTYAATLQQNLMRAATEAAQIMAQDAPIDTGLLRQSIVAVDGREVQQIVRASYRPLLIGEFDEHGG